MKLIHMSDLHIGKRVNGFSMMEDQKYILEKMTDIVKNESPDAVLIAGDIYDKTVPSAEAVRLLDDFIVELSALTAHVFIISGNHDSPERLAFGGRLMEKDGIHISPVYEGRVEPFVLEDSHGKVDIYMLPFIKPAHVRHAFPEKAEEIVTYADAVAVAIESMDVKKERRNVLVAHQFVAGASRSDSEEPPLSVGGSDDVGKEVFTPFDYVALGHIHKPQDIGSQRLRYCGSPLKYSFSEAAHEKSLTVVTLEEKGSLSIRAVPLTPMRDMVEIRGSYSQVMARDFYEGTSYREDYTHVILTDEEEVPEAIGKLRSVYRNLMKMDYDNSRTRNGAQIEEVEHMESRTPAELFAVLYEAQNNAPMSKEQENMIAQLIEEIWEDMR